MGAVSVYSFRRNGSAERIQGFLHRAVAALDDFLIRFVSPRDRHQVGHLTQGRDIATFQVALDDLGLGDRNHRGSGKRLKHAAMGGDQLVIVVKGNNL